MAGHCRSGGPMGAVGICCGAAHTARRIGGTDERFSSVVVDDGTGAFDDKSAAVILQQWFDEGSPECRPQDIEIQ